MAIITRAFVVICLTFIGISIIGEIITIFETIVDFNNDDGNDDVATKMMIMTADDEEYERRRRRQRKRRRRKIIRVPIYQIPPSYDIPENDNNNYDQSLKGYYHDGPNTHRDGSGRPPPSPPQHHHPQRQQHRRSLLQYDEVENYIDGHGTHFVVMRVGNPYSEWTVTLNTNIDFTAFPCVGCTNCHGKIYEQYKSLTYKQPKCVNDECLSVNATMCSTTTSPDGFCTVEYDSPVDLSSFTAHEVRDYVSLGRGDGSFASGDDDEVFSTTTYGFPLTFACQTRHAGWFRTHATDGYLGLGHGRASLVHQMKKGNKIDKLLFALCVTHWLGPNVVDTEGRKGGVLTLGGINAAFHESPLVWAENATPGWRYALYLKRVYLREGGGQWVRPRQAGVVQRVLPVTFDVVVANNPNRTTTFVGGRNNRTSVGIHLDTSTPTTSLPLVVEGAFREAWRQIVGKEFSQKKVKLTQSELLAMPTILFQFQAAKDQEKNGLDPNTVEGMTGTALDPTSPHDLLVAVPATHYMAYSDITDRYRPRLTFGDGGRSYFGANLMQGHDVAFDLDNRRIGFAQVVDCVARDVGSPTSNDDIFATPDLNNPKDNIDRPDVTIVGNDPNDGNPNLDVGDDDEDDDPFNGPITYLPPATTDGYCHSLSCKIWIATGYVAALTFAYVIWKCARVRRRVDVDEFGGDAFADDFVQMGDVYDRRQGYYPTFRNEGMRVNLLDEGTFGLFYPRERMDVRFVDPTFNWNYPTYRDER